MQHYTSHIKESNVTESVEYTGISDDYFADDNDPLSDSISRSIACGRRHKLSKSRIKHLSSENCAFDFKSSVEIFRFSQLCFFLFYECLYKLRPCKSHICKCC